MDALTAWLTVHDFTEGVGTARVLARIDTAMLMANGMHWAIFGTRAVSLRLAAVHVRIAHVIRQALTHRIVCWAGDAERSWMTGVRMACLHGDALDVRYRVWTKPRRTLTDCLVVVCNTNRVHAARILVAGVVTDVRESVAKLVQRTIDVVDAGHRTASRRRVVRIAGVLPGRAFAVCYVIINDAKCIRTACDEIADQLAGKRTVRGAATRLILCTLAVSGATVLTWTMAASTIIRIAGVTR